jgi:hypothetical protein
MDVDRLRVALRFDDPVWVEIWNGRIVENIYTPGKALVAVEDSHHRLMLEPRPGEPVVHIKAAGSRGMFTGLSTINTNEKLIKNTRPGKTGKLFYIILKDDLQCEAPLKPFKDAFAKEIIADRKGHLHYPFAKNLALTQRGYLKRATPKLTKMFVEFLDGAKTLGEAQYAPSDTVGCCRD